MAVKAGVMADTHGLLRPQVLDLLKTCDVILHAGDFDDPRVYAALEAIAPLYAVRGNNDGAWAQALPDSRFFTLEGVTFFMAHERGRIPEDLAGARIAVFGHSHRYFEQTAGGCLLLNPGSCGKRRFHLELSMAVLWLDEGRFRAEKVPLDGGDRAGAAL